MNFLRKINRGAIMAFVLVAGVIVYLIVSAVTQALEQPSLLKACEDYIAAEVKYSVLPEDFRRPEPGMTADEQEQFLSKMKRDIEPLLINDEHYKQLTIDRLTNQLQNQMAGIDVIYNYQKKVVGINETIYKDGLVIVTVQTQTTFEGPGYDNNGMMNNRLNQFDVIRDTIILQKDGNGWKVYAAVISSPYSNISALYGFN